MTYQRLSNLELLLARKKSVKYQAPTEIFGVPVEQDQRAESDQGSNCDSDSHGDSPGDKDAEDAERAACEEEEIQDNRDREGYPPAPVLMCSPLPAMCEISKFLGEPVNLHRRGPHAAYAREYFQLSPKVHTHAIGKVGDMPLPADTPVASGGAAYVNALAETQTSFFKKLDEFDVQAETACNTSHADVSTPDRGKSVPRSEVHSALSSFSSRRPSHTLVLEAAIHLIQHGFCDIRNSDRINVKWALVLLHFAIWMQLKMSRKWCKTGDVLASELCDPGLCKELKELFKDGVDNDQVPLLVMIIVGAAGSGKTSLLKILEPFSDYFFQRIETMHKSAPTNQASRVAGGDTCHARYKLPFGSLKGKRGTLSPAVLKIFRRMWDGAEEHVIDEISMLAPNSLFQIESRTRTATRQRGILFGGLGTFLTGDFSQLPHPTQPSLALPLDEEEGTYRHANKKHPQGTAGEEEEAEEITEEAFFEHRAGVEKWRSIAKVSVLTVNLRSPGMLSDILHDIRNRRISDKSWQLLQERVLGVEREGEVLRQKFAPDNDPRLTRPPFSDHCVQYIVHRHVLRISQSFHNVMRASMQAGKRVYLALAADTVKPGDAVLFTDKVRREVLQIANPRLVHHLPGSCLWYIGMKLLLFSKKCARLGLMNGCICTLVDIIFSEHEQLPGHVEPGDVIPLQYMPTALLLRAEDVEWFLPPSQLPDLPPQVT